MSLDLVIKKLKRLISLVDNIQVAHFLYLWFFSVLGFLAMFVISTNFLTLEIDETWFGNSRLFSILFYGFIILGFISFGLALLLMVVNIFMNGRIYKTAKLVLLLLIIFISTLGIYQMGLSHGKTSVVFEATREDVKKYCDLVEDDSTQKLPVCNYGHCPEFRAMDTDDDFRIETVVLQPIAMTKGAADVWIIDNDEIVFRHGGGAMLSYKQNEDMPGITISYVKEFDETGLNPKTWESEKWLYLDNEYVLFEDREGFCEEYVDLDSEDEAIVTFEGIPEYPDYSFEPEASRFKTAINNAIDFGVNFAGHYSVATWGCGTDCFGYAVVDVSSGDVVAFSSANENYNISGLEIKGRYMILNPVSAGQDKKYYKLSEDKNYSGEIISMFDLVCTEESTQNIYGLPE